jgi:galacturan 1,4-alpha-galacturonidase
MHYLSFAFVVLAPLLATASPVGRCTGTISSLNEVSNAQKCTTININGFTVPAGKTFALSLLDGTTVNLKGDIKFGVANWKGPLFQITGKNVICELHLMYVWAIPLIKQTSQW